MAYEEENFHPLFVWAVNQSLAECGGAKVGSGFRTVSAQAGLLYKRGQGISVAEPGHSRHNGAENVGGIEGARGGAVDMSGDLECFARVGSRYGLSNTMVEGEPWHFQFTDAAWEAVANGTYAEMFGIGVAGEEEPEDSLAGLRAIIFGGQGVGENPVDVPERVAEAFAPDARGQAADEFTPEASAGFEQGEGGALSAVDVARHYAEAGFTGEALVTMVAIAKGESGWNPAAEGDTSLQDGTWGPSLGLSQIRSLHSQKGTEGWRNPDRLRDPAFNARAAFAISNGGTNFGPWTVFTKGIYTQHMDEARAAVAALGTGAVGHRGPPAASVEPDDDGLGIAEEELLDPVGIAQEIAEAVLAQPETSPAERATGDAPTLAPEEDEVTV